jgi:PBP1b-binding outer membrane lipoprotein LpoB
MVTMAPNTHECIKEDKINHIQEDLTTIKIALGYKEKSNGEFREEVETETSSLNERMTNIEKLLISIDERQKALETLINLLIGCSVGALALIAIF